MQPKNHEMPVNFDLARVQQSIASGFVQTPKFDNVADVLAWMESQ